MPAYQFVTDEGERVDLHLSFSEFDRRVKDDTITLDDGRMAKYDWSGHSFVSTVPSNYPMVCSAAGVDPSQVKEHMDYLRAAGCGQVNHNKDGDMIFEDKHQRKKVLETLGMYDRNGSYSDPSPRYRTSCKRYR